MDSTIKQILGEARGEQEEPQEKPNQAEVPAGEAAPVAAPEDAEIDEITNMWQTGNKGEVVRRFMEMDNEKSVKLVFAIGRDGAIELARMVDQAIELGSTGNEDTTEPERVEPPEHENDAVREIIGRPHVMPP